MNGWVDSGIRRVGDDTPIWLCAHCQTLVRLACEPPVEMHRRLDCVPQG